MADHDQRIEIAIRNSLARVEDTSAEARQGVYSAVLRALDRHQQSTGDVDTERSRQGRQRLAALIDQIESGYVTSMLADDLESLSIDPPGMATEAVQHTEMPHVDGSAATASGGGRGSFWFLTFVVAAVFVGALGYAYSTGWFATAQNGPAEFEAAPPALVAFNDTYAIALNEADKSVTVANKGQRADPSQLSPNLVLSSDLEESFSGKTIEVTISARSPVGTAAAQLMAIYYTGGVGNSGPQIFPLTSEYADHTFTYEVPSRVGAPGEDYLGIASASGKAGAAIDVRSLKIRTR